MTLDLSGQSADEYQVGFSITTRRQCAAVAHSGREEDVGSSYSIDSGIDTGQRIGTVDSSLHQQRILGIKHAPGRPRKQRRTWSVDA